MYYFFKYYLIILESQSRAGNKAFPAPKGGRSVPWAEVDLNSYLFDD